VKALVGVDGKHGPVWLVTYEEKEVGSSMFESEERKVAFLSPSSLIHVDSGDVLEFKQVEVSQTDMTINRLACYIFTFNSLSLSKPTKFTIFP